MRIERKGNVVVISGTWGCIHNMVEVPVKDFCKFAKKELGLMTYNEAMVKLACETDYPNW